MRENTFTFNKSTAETSRSNITLPKSFKCVRREPAMKLKTSAAVQEDRN